MSQQASPGLAALLAAMREAPSVPDGWDAMLTLSQPAVQALAQAGWAVASRANGGRPRLWMAPAPVDGRHDVVEIAADLPSPSVGLDAGDQTVHVAFELAGGTVRCGHAPAEAVSRLPDTDAVVGSGDVTWSDPVAISPQNPLRLTGSVPLAIDAPEAEGRFAIGLGLAAGKLSLSGQALNRDLTQWRTAQAADCGIGTLASREASAATVLTSARVTARVAAALDGRPVLQILTGTAPGATAPEAGAPVPHPEDHDFSLVVTSEVAMGMIAAGYNRGTGAIKLVAQPPQDGQRHWFAEVYEPMVFEGRFGHPNGTVYASDHARFFMRFGGSSDQGLQLFTATDPASTVRLQLDLAAHYPIAIGGTGAGQVVGLREGAQSVTGHGFYEQLVQPQLEAFLTGDIRSDMARVRLNAVSDFLLRDLTLSSHRLQFELVALPGELLVAGSLVPGT